MSFRHNFNTTFRPQTTWTGIWFKMHISFHGKVQNPKKLNYLRSLFSPNANVSKKVIKLKTAGYYKMHKIPQTFHLTNRCCRDIKLPRHHILNKENVPLLWGDYPTHICNRPAFFYLNYPLPKLIHQFAQNSSANTTLWFSALQRPICSKCTYQ